jgi:2-polyprenyl-6-methoxyphenol hydroxylase-like FAD-dependent oxidoreductase
MNRNARIAIVGGSLIGPLTAVMLRNAGFRNVNVFEAAKATRPQSGGVIGIREWNLAVLNGEGIPTSEVVAYPTKDVITYDVNDSEVTGMRDHTMYPGESTAWDIFHKAVTSRTPVVYGHKVTDVIGNSLHFAHGSTAEFDLVIFADGRKSTGRTQFAPSRTLEYAGYLVWRGLYPTESLNAGHDVLGFERYRDDTNGILYSVTERITQGSHAGMSDWTLYHTLSRDEYVTMNNGKGPEELAFMLPNNMTPYAHYIMCSVARRFLPEWAAKSVQHTPAIMAVPMNDVDLPTKAFWPTGRGYAAIVGDALEPVRPHSGRGVNNGIEQATELVRALSDTVDPWVALNDWESSVLPKIHEFVELGQGRAERNNLGKVKVI